MLKPLATTVSLAALLLGSAPAFAQSSQEIVDAFVAALNGDGNLEVTYDGPVEEGDAIVLSNVHATSTTDDGAFDAETLTLTGAALAGGMLDVATVDVAGLTITSPDGGASGESVSIGGLSIDTGRIGQEGGTEPAASIETAEFANFEFTEGDAVVGGFESASLENSDFAGMMPRAAALSITNFDINLEADPENAEAVAQLAALGYEDVVFDMTVDAAWLAESGDFNISDFTLDVHDMGSLSLALELGGFTPEVMTQLQSGGEPNEELLNQLTLKSISFTFNDASLTGRVLDMQGQAQGVSGAEFAEQISAMLPLLLGQLQNPAFQTEVANAVGTFLREPGSLTVDAAPGEPVAFMALAGMAMMAPQTLPEMLGIRISANGGAK